MVDFDPRKLRQAKEAMETIVDEIAEVVYSYYEALVRLGFSEEQASVLTNAFQSIWWAAMFREMGHKD